MNRRRLLRRLADDTVAIRRPHPIRVAIDGPDVAGKTTLADELAQVVQNSGRPVIRASVDGFHRPRADRHRRGAYSPEGYCHDSFYYDALRLALLTPLGPGGTRRYRTAVFDFRTDTPTRGPLLPAHTESVLLFDGVFLLRPEIAGQWDYRVFLSVDSETILKRALLRDVDSVGSTDAVEPRYSRRYIPAQRLYMETARPHEVADAIVDNNYPLNPRLLVPVR